MDRLVDGVCELVRFSVSWVDSWKFREVVKFEENFVKQNSIPQILFQTRKDVQSFNPIFVCL